MYYAANPLGGGFKIVNDVVRRTVAAAFRFESMTGADQECNGAGTQASLNVGAFISHQKRACGIGRQSPRGIFDKAGLRLTADAVILGPVRTDVNSVQCGAISSQEFYHTPIDRAKGFGQALAAAHRRLIADHDNTNAEAIQHSNTLGSPGQQLHAFDRGQVMPLDVDRSIAIEKYEHTQSGFSTR
jgi:hypothetical protein